MCAAHDGQSDEFGKYLEQATAGFTAAFVLEAALKLLGLGGSGYFAERWNCFDITVTMCSVVDLALEKVAPELSTPVLRGLRVARILRLLRFNSHMRRFESMVVKVAPTVLNMSAIVFLFLVIFSLLGVELYAGKMRDSRSHYDRFWPAMTSSFIVASGENWNEVLADSLAEGGVPYATSCLFFSSLFVMMNFVRPYQEGAREGAMP
jgi:hypothetical protein